MKQVLASQGKIRAKEKEKFPNFFLDVMSWLGYNKSIKSEIGG